MRAVIFILSLLALPLSAKNHPTAECRWLYDRMAALKLAIKQGDTLGTREELARWQVEFHNKQCHQYDY